MHITQSNVSQSLSLLIILSELIWHQELNKSLTQAAKLQKDIRLIFIVQSKLIAELLFWQFYLKVTLSIMTLNLLFEVLPNTTVNKLNEFHKKKLNIKAVHS